MTRVLMKQDEADDAVIAELARLEFRAGDYDAVTNWAQAYPENAPLNLLAAQSAIRQGNPVGLRIYEGRLELEPEAVLSLIELDAATNRWMVSDEIYAAAAALSDPVLKQRADRVFAMRTSARELANPKKSKLAMGQVSSVLGPRLEQVTGGTH